MSKPENVSFRATALSSASGLSNPVRNTATASPSPAPSQNVAPGSQGPKNKLPDSTTLNADSIYSQPANTGTGTNLMTQITFAIEHLREKRRPFTLEDLISYLSLHNLTEQDTQLLKRALQNHPSVSFNPAGLDGKGSYSFKSRYDIHNSSQLLRHLQGLPTFQGLPAHDLVEGWSSSEENIRDLEMENKVLVLRSRKDDKAKMVWLDDSTLARPIDSEFRDMWGRIKLPDPEATASELERKGLLPTNKFKKPKAAPKAQVKKAKKSKRSGKITNHHMQHLLKDFSNLRK